MSDEAKQRRLKIVQFDQTTPPQPAPRVQRSGSLTGLSTLHRGVSELESLVGKQAELINNQGTALTDAIAHMKVQGDQIEKQELIIAGYQEKLSELDYLIDRIISG